MRSYVLTLMAAVPAVFVLLWAYVWVFPMGFMDEEYPPFAAKLAMLDACDFGSFVIVGDSNAAVGLIPDSLPGHPANLAFLNGSPIEAYVVLRKSLTCAKPPRLLLYSLTMGGFSNGHGLWDSSARFGVFSPSDLQAILTESETIGELLEQSIDAHDGLPSSTRRWVYSLRLPNLYSKGLIERMVVGRTLWNWADIHHYLRTRGSMQLGQERGNSTVFEDGFLSEFSPKPVMDSYFEHLLDLADQRHVQIAFVMAPANVATKNAIPPSVLAKFHTYLDEKKSRHPSLHLISTTRPTWPDRFFGDAIGHLNREGAALFSERLSACVLLDGDRAYAIRDDCLFLAIGD